MNMRLFLAAMVLPACSMLAPEPPRPLEPAVRKLAGDMRFTEGPVWMAADNRLLFSDIPASNLMSWSAQDGLSVFRRADHPNGNLLDERGRLLTCQHGARNVIRTEPDGSIEILASSYEGKRFNSPNDLAVESDGTVWFTDPPWGLRGRGAEKEQAGHFVFRLDPASGEVTCVLRDHVMPNGIALSPDERTLYLADTGGHRSHPDPTFRDRPATITAYPIAKDKALGPPRWSVQARCDGMCIDERGRLYASDRNGITIWSPAGKKVGAIQVPEPPTNVCFGGPEFRTLFITARTSLYAIEMDVRGKRLASPPSDGQSSDGSPKTRDSAGN